MKWNTHITQITKTKYPLIMGAFAGLGKTDLAAAFSNAGGLGIITALNYTLEEFKSELKRMKQLTDKPFGINLTVIPQADNLISSQLTQGDYLKYVEAALNFTNIFTTSAYQANFIGKRVKEAGCYWFHKCVLMRHAISVEKEGVDAITLMGMESSGFKNPYQQTTLVNLTMAKRLLKVPIIAAGGIGDARGFLGALTMGAEAVCLGTAILITKESPLQEELKSRWLETDIFSEEYHHQLYHFKLQSTRVPSTAVAFQKEVIPVKILIENIINEAEDILKSMGFTNEEFKTIS
jgi:NAD(P)H-dependent flavin oxidoreductase YrpB (nitropropane dioxygenase family)